ncbi:aquaporin Z [Leucobacter exalbidus]|uniref:Aquaporin Z n=1 Tax=Leucobacter exalbidus TaxID=662960 RepID=A0A940T2E5_9MICO|nr:aquaporin Z [Leucobacter exalbidus]MBP1324977.1 aquaporin Z [Leucobacter exalbidus]
MSAKSSAPSAPPPPTMGRKLAAEVFGTFLLVLGGVGTAVFAANFPDAENNSLGVGFVGVALAFGLTVLVGIYAVGHISGGHFNPAVTLGAAVAGRIPWKDAPSYWVAQIIGGVLGSTVVYVIAVGGPDGFATNAVAGGFASNGFGEHSPGGFSLVSVLIAEIVLTAVFLFVILGATSNRAPAGFAGLAIGLTLTLIHLISIPISNTSVNPARSIAAAIYGGPDVLAQVWLFILAPLVGALIAGVAYRPLFEGRKP